MARRCELTGKGVMVGNNVSHANNKTKRQFRPNLVDVTLMSESLGHRYKMRVAASSLRTVEHRGGLDKFLLAAKDDTLSPRMLKLKRELAAAGTPAADAPESPAT